MWPTIDLVAFTRIWSARLLNTRRIAVTSTGSPMGVDVAWALMWSTADGAIPASRRASSMVTAISEPSSLGTTMW